MYVPHTCVFLTQGPFCLTGGEDGRICLWSLESAATAQQAGLSSNFGCIQTDGGGSGHNSVGRTSVGGHEPGSRQGHQSHNDRKEQRKHLPGSQQFRMKSPY